MSRVFGSIAHLPGSRVGKTDRYITEDQARIATVKPRDRHDKILVQEKLDGACVAVVKENGELIPITRSGNLCQKSQYVHHHLFADWMYEHYYHFYNVLLEGERIVGEWLALAHGTRYYTDRILGWEPFVAFDIFTPDNKRLCYDQFIHRIESLFHSPPLVHHGYPCSIEMARELMPESNYGGEHVEGYIWRIERKDEVDYLCKWVNDAFQPGCLLPEMSGNLVWNWQP